MIIHNASDFETTNIEFQKKYIGTEKNLILTVDNVFSNPDLVLEKIKEYPLVKSDEKFENLYPGYVTFLTIPNWNIDKIISSALYNFFMAEGDLTPVIRLNVLNNKDKIYKQALIPHVDSCRYAGQLYLCDYPNSYTAFYRHKKTGFETQIREFRYKEEYQEINSLYDHNHASLYDRKRMGEYINYDSIDEDENWECYHKEPVVKNRLIIHAGNLYHSAYVKSKYDYEDLRYSIALFV